MIDWPKFDAGQSGTSKKKNWAIYHYMDQDIGAPRRWISRKFFLQASQSFHCTVICKNEIKRADFFCRGGILEDGIRIL